MLPFQELKHILKEELKEKFKGGLSIMILSFVSIYIFYFYYLSLLVTVNGQWEGWVRGGVLLTKYGYDLYNQWYTTDGENDKSNTKLLQLNLVYKDRMKLVHLAIKPNVISPFNKLQKESKLLLNDEWNPMFCKLYYYESSKPYVILDDEMLLTMFKRKYQSNGVSQTVEISCNSFRNTEKKIIVQRKEAYEHVTKRTLTNHLSVNQIDTVREELEEMVLGEYDVNAVAIGSHGVEKNAVINTMNNIADKYGWSERIKSMIDASVVSQSQFGADINTTFKDKQIKGSYIRFMCWKDEKDDSSSEDTYSFYIATSQFTYDVPSVQLEQNGVMPKWLSSSGNIKYKTSKQIKIVMEDEAAQAARAQLIDPGRRHSEL